MGQCAGKSQEISRSNQVIKTLNQHINPNAIVQLGLAPLHLACEIGDEETVKFLLAIGAKVDLHTDKSQGCVPPIIFAASNGHAGCLKVLLEGGANPDIQDYWRNTALFKAACYNYVDCVKVLLDYNANPDLGNQWGAIPLQYASFQGNHQCVKLLLGNGADPMEIGDEGTPQTLIAASARGHTQCVKHILQYCTDVNYSKNNNGETALVLGLKYFLMDCSGYDFTRVTMATLYDRLVCLQQLIKHGATVSEMCLQVLQDTTTTLGSNTWECVLAWKLLLQSFRSNAGNRKSLAASFAEFPRFGKSKWPLIQLVCSVGYTPTTDEIDSVMLTDEEVESLHKLRKNPRTLQDLCRNTVRGCLEKNVVYSAKKLPTPKLVTDYILIKHPADYVL